MKNCIVLEQIGRKANSSMRLLRVLGVAISLTAVSASAGYAQEKFEFIDPLDDMRSNLSERENSRLKAWESSAPSMSPTPRQSSQSSREEQAAQQSEAQQNNRGIAGQFEGAAREGYQTAQAGASHLKSGLAGIFDRLGLSKNMGLLLLGLLLIGMLALLSWLFFRNSEGVDYFRRREVGDDYELDDEEIQRNRRTMISRLGRGSSDSHNYDEDTSSSDEESIYISDAVSSRRRRAPSAMKRRDAFLRDSSDTDQQPEQSMSERGDALQHKNVPHQENTDTWRKPNLDRLKSSIKSDWNEARNFAKNEAARSASETGQAKSTVDLVAQNRAKLNQKSDWDSWDNAMENKEPTVSVPDEPMKAAKKIRRAKASARGTEALMRLRALRETMNPDGAGVEA